MCVYLLLCALSLCVYVGRCVSNFKNIHLKNCYLGSVGSYSIVTVYRVSSVRIPSNLKNVHYPDELQSWHAKM